MSEREDFSPALGGDRADDPPSEPTPEPAPEADLETQLNDWLDGTMRMFEERLPATADAIDGLFQALHDALGTWIERGWPR
ncbi:MAG TPA: hypothetical protein V6D47_19085 [Oscillatoriaceae cyanobacterium]